MLNPLTKEKIKGLFSNKKVYQDWCKFNLVGLLGIIVQLSLLKILVLLDVGYIVATAIAVEITIVHNFFWHEYWTWRDRVNQNLSDRFFRWLRFNTTTGLISLVGNLLFMKLLVGSVHLPITLANLLTIGLCATFNFLVSDQFVFRKRVLGSLS